jgi:sulfite reductase alpha subunit-like flavoprotein
MKEAVGTDGGDVLVIRVWNEPESVRPFRARVSYGGEQQPITADPEAVIAAVRHWLADHDPGARSAS